ncbi:MAG: DNA polymerase III subunit delta [Patescibacteria group bacterium]|jgi:DNA polymerase-3 subunit delta
MVLFFYGDDAYRSFQKLQELKRKYVDASLGDTNLAHLDGASLEPNALAAALLALPFLAKTRLVVLDGLLSRGSKELQEKFLDILPKLPESTNVVVYEARTPDKRTSGFKRLLKETKAQEFAVLEGAQLAAWIDAELAARGATITRSARDELVRRADESSWKLATELQKLSAAVADRPDGERVIDDALVHDLVQGVPTESVFALTDALASGNTEAALARLRVLLEQGENAQQLVALLASTLRTFLLIRDALDRGVTREPAIADATGLKPFVIRKNLAAARAQSFGELVGLMRALAELDVATKRGTIDPEVGLELFVAKA